MTKTTKYFLLGSGAVLAFVFLIPIWRSPYNGEYVDLFSWTFQGVKHKQLTHVKVKTAILRAKARLLLEANRD